MPGEAKTVTGHVKRVLGELGLLDAKKVAVRVCCRSDANHQLLEVCPLYFSAGDVLACRHPDAGDKRVRSGFDVGEENILHVPDWCPLRRQSLVISLHPDAK